MLGVDGRRMGSSLTDPDNEFRLIPRGSSELSRLTKSSALAARGRQLIGNLTLAADGGALATATRDAPKARVGAPCKLAFTFEAHEFQAENLTYSPDGKRLATCGHSDGTVKVWDAATGQNMLTLNERSSVSFSSDGKRVVSGWSTNNGHTRQIHVWDTETGQELLTLEEHTVLAEHAAPKIYTAGYRDVSFSPDGKFLASCDEDDTVTWWDAETGQSLFKARGNYVLSVAFSPDGKLIVCGDVGTVNVRVWDTKTGQCMPTLKGDRHIDCYTTVVNFSPDGKLIASGDRDCMVMVWDAETGEKMLELKGQEAIVDREYVFPVQSVNFSQDGKRIASCGGLGTIKVWNTETGREVFSSDTVLYCPTAVSFSPDLKRIAAGISGGTVEVWDLNLPG